MAESLKEAVERLEREYRATSRFGRYAHRRLRHWNEIGEEEALWLETHPRAASAMITRHRRRKRRANRKEAWWRRRRDLSDRRKARRGKALRRARRAWRRRRRAWRRRPIRWSGNPSNVSRRVKLVIRFSQFRRPFNATVTSTTGGQHTPTSWHYRNRAVDEVEDEMVRLQAALLNEFGAEYFLELYGPATWYVKNGVVYQGRFPGHDDHIHAAA